MKDNLDERLKFNFAGMGSNAPKPVPQNEIWLDVGNRVDVRVLDHHRGGASSSAQLVLTRIHDLVVPHVDLNAPLQIVIHQEPDLDCLCAAWLVKKHLFAGVDIQSSAPIQEIVRAVNDNDQGLIRTNEPLQCWPIIMRTLIGKANELFPDERIISEVFPPLERTLEILSRGGTLAEAANNILTPELRVLLSLEQKDYQQDLANGITFQVALPLHSAFSSVKTAEKKAEYTERRVLVDGLFLQNPSSPLFKELARSDREHSPLRQGFPFLVVAGDVAWEDGQTFQRYIISVDPLTGLHLKGLGELLEAREQAKEDESKKPLLPGRERVDPGQGRFGGTIVSPWYDGRGHNYTIIDCPSIGTGKKKPCFSQLSRSEVLDKVWEYADPAWFAEVQAAERIQFRVAPPSPAGALAGDRCPFLDSVIAQTDKQCRWGTDIKLLAERCGSTPLPGSDDEIKWDFFADVSIMTRKTLPAGREARSLRQVIDSFADHLPDASVEATLSVIDIPENAFQKLELAPLLISFSRLAHGRGSSFPGMREWLDCGRPVQVVSPNRQGLFLIYSGGCVLVRSIPSQGTAFPAEPFEMLVALAMASRRRLDGLSTEILSHLRITHPSKMGKRLRQDREKLLQFQQSAMFGFVCEEPFIQQVHEALQSHWEIPRKFDQESQRVNALAQSFREASDALSAKLSFIVTTAIAPLLLTLAFFSATFMDTDFHSKYRTFFPTRFILWLAAVLGISPGWSAFISVLGSFAFFFAVVWAAITRLGKGRKPK
jgi:hypothetical protein